MKKLLITLLMPLLYFSLLFAVPNWAIPRIWYENDFTSSYRNNVINLESVYYMPKMETIYASASTAQNGTYSKINTLGQVGCAYCSKDIVFTIETTGRFVSQSDLTKYREFYIAVVPRVRYDLANRFDATKDDANCADRTYFSSQTVQSTDYVPNTRDNGYCFTVTAPANYYDRDYRIYVGGDAGSTYQHVFRFWMDILIIMDPITPDDEKHLIENDDYYASINVSWAQGSGGDGRATDPAQPSYTGSFQFNLRGYYQATTSSSSDSLAMFVTPTYDSQNMDIASILDDSKNPDHEKKIAEYSIYTSTVKKETERWVVNNTGEVRLKAFISAADSWDGTSSNGFMLSNRTTDIPFAVIIRDAHDSTNETIFYGKDTWPTNNVINLPVTEVRDRQGKEYNMISYTGNVYIKFEDENDSREMPSELTAGIYSSPIHYYLVYY